jgi:hypothetical protein
VLNGKLANAKKKKKKKTKAFLEENLNLHVYIEENIYLKKSWQKKYILP